jgi:hypothetical protein
MILVQIQQLETAKTIVQSASKLAMQFGKELAVLSFVDLNELISERKNELKTAFDLTENQIFVRNSNQSVLSEVCEELDASFLFIQLTDDRLIRKGLKNCRDLRIPYMFFKDMFEELDLRRVILPIGFLEEEMEKAQFASAFGRFCGSEIKMMLANDYGTKAAVNAEKMKQLFANFYFRYNLEKATKDSFKVEEESVHVAENEKAGIIIFLLHVIMDWMILFSDQKNITW